MIAEEAQERYLSRMAGRGPVGPSAATYKRLFAVSGNQCAFPGCTQSLYEKGVLVGEVCHIKGDKPKAARYDKNQSDEDRQSFANLIVLCSTHHTIIDSDAKSYTPDRLYDMKRLHEGNKQTKFGISDAEAARLAFFAGGMTLGTALGAAAAALADLIRPAKPSPPVPSDEPARLPYGEEWKPFIQALRKIGPGKVAVAAREPFSAFGRIFAIEFVLHGRWQEADPRYYIDGEVPQRLVLMILEHPNPGALKELMPHIERLLSIMGFKRIDDPRRAIWANEEYSSITMQFMVLQVRPGEHATM